MTGPFEVLSRIPNSTYRIYGKTARSVRDIRGLRLMPDAGLADAPPLDVLHVPGGFGQEALMEDAEVLGWIRQQAAGACSIFSVCTGALLCGAAGLLKGRRATAHWASLHLLPFFGAIPVNERVVVDGSFVFAAGGVGIEVTKSVGLEPVGYNPKQQMAGEMFRGRLAKCVPPTNPQLLQIEIAQESDLIFD